MKLTKIFYMRIFFWIVVLGVWLCYAANVQAATLKEHAADAPVKLILISTPKGEITLYLYDGTPKHKANFLKLVQDGFFDGTTFHRVIQGFVIQGGDPNSKDADPVNDGEGGPGYEIDAEIYPQYFHKRGAIGAARNGDEVNPLQKSSGCQFYIVLGKVWTNGGLDSQQVRVQESQKNKFAREFWNRPENSYVSKIDFRALQQNNPDSLQRLYKKLMDVQGAAFDKEQKLFVFTPEERAIYTTLGGTPHLDRSYTVFGEVLAGMDIAEQIATVTKDSRDRPIENIPMKVKIVEMDRKKFEATYKMKPK